MLTGRHLSRRAVLKGLGVTIGLPFLDAMVPAGTVRAARRAPQRLVCIEMVHGCAGSSQIGAAKHLWAPAATGRAFDLTPTSLRSLEPFRDVLTVVSNCDVANAEPFEAREIGGDHVRSSAVFLTQAHPRRTLGADVEAGTSLDQLVAQRISQETPLPSLQLCIETIDQGGALSFGYASAYTDTISWASPTKPLPMMRDPRVVFDTLVGVFGEGATAEARRQSRAEQRSILDWVLNSAADLRRRVGAGDRARLDDYLDNLREIERRLQAVERLNRSGEPREFPAAPAGVPDSFSDHVKLMFDLQVMAFRSDITRVSSFKLGRDNSNRVYPESGFDGPFHPASHHGGQEAKILDFAKLNAFHVGLVPHFLEQLRQTPDVEGSLLDNTVLIYGSPMGDSNLHNHRRVPFFVVGTAAGRIKGGTHVKAPSGTPLANAMLTVLHAHGLDDIAQFGDSDGALDLNG